MADAAGTDVAVHEGDWVSVQQLLTRRSAHGIVRRDDPFLGKDAVFNKLGLNGGMCDSVDDVQISAQWSWANPPADHDRLCESEQPELILPVQPSGDGAAMALL